MSRTIIKENPRLCINCIYCSTDLSGKGYCSLTGEDKELWSVYHTCGFYEFDSPEETKNV